MKLKKLSRKITLYLLTIGASLILGFLSFGGMFALSPILPLALTAFVLSVAYEGEIYLQNITGAWNKLFKFKHLERQLANDYLLDNFPDTKDTACPEFFKDYEKQLRIVDVFGHARLNKASKARKKREEKTLADMEKLFAIMLFGEGDSNKPTHDATLETWFKTEPQKENRKHTLLKLQSYNNAFWWMKRFSVLAAIFMSLGTTYLLVEAFSAIPFFASISFSTWPLFILPMATIAGAAYGLLTYNAITDMYNSDTVNKWLKDLNIRKAGLTTRTFLAFSLMALALMLTVCTAGTWWTVVKETRPLLSWIGKLPSFIMGVINPLITGLSAVIFNLQNTHESLELIMNTIPRAGALLSKAFKSIPQRINALRKRENIMQVLNPFRLIVTATIMPLRILLFVGHLISIGVTADRLPGVSTFFSALMGIISECFEDIHYFFGHSEEAECGHHGHGHPKAPPSRQSLLEARLKAGGGHHHDLDIPTWMIEGVFTPVYYLAVGWDYLFGQFNSKPITFAKAQEKMGFKKEIDISPSVEPAKQPSMGSTVAHAIQRIERYKEKQLGGEANEVLTDLQNALRDSKPPTKERLVEIIEAQAATVNRNGFFAIHTFLKEELPERIHLTTAA